MPPVITAREQLRAMVEEVPDDLLRDAIYALTHLEDDEPCPNKKQRILSLRTTTLRMAE